MIAVVQRVSSASVEIDKVIKGKIGFGLMVLIGVEEADTKEDVEWLSSKIIGLRIFNDQDGVMNISIKDVNGELLIISQFTLHASTKKGNRPSYIKAAKPDVAIPMYELFLKTSSEMLGRGVQSGIFGADMKVALVNDGPVTIIIDTKNKA